MSKLKPKFDDAALAFAAVYATQYRNKTVVIKMGGEVLDHADPKILDDILKQAIYLRLFGANVVVVHGGGKQIDNALKAAGHSDSLKIDGIRVYSEEELSIADNQAESLSDNIIARIDQIGHQFGADIRGKNMHHREILSAHQMYEGKFTGTFNLDNSLSNRSSAEAQKSCHAFVDTAKLKEVLSNPVNIHVVNWMANGLATNADDAAGVIAIAMGAKRLMFFSTDKAGKILGIHDKQGELIREVSPEGINELIADGTIAGGMIPKAQICKYAILAGVEGVVILNPTIHNNIVEELLLSKEGSGTLIRHANSNSATKQYAPMPVPKGLG